MSPIGEKYGRLTVVEVTRKCGRKYWRSVCECGGKSCVAATEVRAGRIKSCGCLGKEALSARREVNRTHGASRTSEYITWGSMIARCENPKTHNFKRYGGRGIKVCSQWRKSFEQFLKDMGARPGPEYSIDRINVHGDYTPENCRWVTLSVQSRNKHNSIHVEVNGSSVPFAQFYATVPAIAPYKNAVGRIRLGWTVEDAIYTPVRA